MHIQNWDAALFLNAVYGEKKINISKTNFLYV